MLTPLFPNNRKQVELKMKKKVTYSIKITKGLNEKLSDYSRVTGLNKTAIGNAALQMYFEESDKAMARACQIAGVDPDDDVFAENYGRLILDIESIVKRGVIDRQIADEQIKSWGAKWRGKTKKGERC